MKSFFLKFTEPKYLLKIAILAAVYYCSAVLGQSFAYSINKISLVWPPVGVSLAALIVFGLDLWPGVTIGALLATVTTQPTLFIALGITLGNTIEAIGAVYLLNLFEFKRSFESVKDVTVFIIFAAALSTLISAIIGTLSLILGGVGNWNSFLPIWSKWWVGDFLGDMIIAPPLLVWSRFAKFKLNYAYILQGILLFVVVALTSIGLFTGTFTQFSFNVQSQFKFLIFPLLIWASYKFKQKGSTLAVLLVTAICVWGVVTGSGPFVMAGNFDQSLIYLGVFAASISLTFMVFSVVIEQRDRAESEVVDSEKRFKSLIENSSDVIVLIDSKGAINYTSPSTYKVLQYTPEELLGTSAFDRIHPDDKARLISLFQQLISKPNKVISATFRLVRKDQSIIWVDGVGTNLLSDPTVSSVILNYRDVTERIKLDESKTEFVSLSAHQLRGPVATIRWYTESLMKAKAFPANLEGNLTEIYKSILSMNDAINLLLNVSRFELGTVEIKGAPVNLRGVVMDVLSEQEKFIKDRDIKVTNSTKVKIPDIIGDVDLIKIILENLIGNAIKYTPKGGKINVSLTPQEDNILFKIKDSGIGIPIKDQPKIFTKLFRGSNVKKLEPRGLGLGLYLIKLVVDLKGGSIWFESEEDKGTTFFVEFPKRIKTTAK